MAKINYLNNKDFLAEIHKAKLSYCSFEREEYCRYDAIVSKVAEITPELVAQTLETKAALLAKRGAAAWDGADPGQPVTVDGLVIRVMSCAHIPEDDGLSKRRWSSNGRVRTPFPPFSHYVIRDDQPVEVGRSHWIGSLSNGHFSATHGAISPKLARMFMMLVERYSSRGNFRGYSYVEELRGQALVQLSEVGLQFNEAKSDNPFAFYTQVIKNCFVKILNAEKKAKNIRDELLMAAGMSPSYSRQIDEEFASYNQ